MGVLIDHHMLVVEVIDKTHLVVIHYTGRDDTDGNSGQATVSIGASSGSSSGLSVGEVKEEIIEIDLIGETYQKLEYKDGVALYTGKDAVNRARKRLSEAKYNVFFNNCESLINWAITGKNKTIQGEVALAEAAIGTAVGVGVGVGVLGVIGYGIYSLIRGGENDDSD